MMPEPLYDKPEKFKLVPERKILEPFGLMSSSSFNRGTFFGRKGQLIYRIFSPIDADDFSYDPISKTLTLFEHHLGFRMKIYGIKTLTLSGRRREISRGELIGTASSFRSMKPGVYVECIVTMESFKSELETRFESLEKGTEKSYLKTWSDSQGIGYLDFKRDIGIMKRKEKISLLNPYMSIQRENPRQPYVCFFNYSALFC